MCFTAVTSYNPWCGFISSQNDSNGSDDESEQSEEYVPSDGDSGGEEYEEEDSDEDYSSVSEGSESGMWQSWRWVWPLLIDGYVHIACLWPCSRPLFFYKGKCGVCTDKINVLELFLASGT